MNFDGELKGDEMDEQAIFERVRAILEERLAVPQDGITWDSLLKEDLEVDSLDLVNLSMVVEDEYGIDILDGEAEDIRTVGDVVRLIKNSLLSRDGEAK